MSGPAPATLSRRQTQAHPSARRLENIAHHPRPRPQRIAGQVGQGRILDHDHLERRTVGAGRNGFLLGEAAGTGNGFLARQVMKDLVDLAADLGGLFARGLWASVRCRRLVRGWLGAAADQRRQASCSSWKFDLAVVYLRYPVGNLLPIDITG
jgi:hypothetical protein